jgi:hypothetical protein
MHANHVSTVALLALTPVLALICTLYIRFAQPASVLFTFRGIFTSSLVFPIIFSLTWRLCTSWGAALGVVFGQIFGVIAWLACAYVQHGSIDMASMSSMEAILAANLTSLLASPMIAISVSYLRRNNVPVTSEDTHDTHAQLNSDMSFTRLQSNASATNSEGKHAPYYTRAMFLAVAATILIIVVWPLLMLPARVFDEVYFTCWITLCFVCAILSALICICLPLIEAYMCIFDGSRANSVHRHGSTFFGHGSSINMLLNFMRSRDFEGLADMHNKDEEENKRATNCEDDHSQRSDCGDRVTGKDSRGAQIPQAQGGSMRAKRTQSAILEQCKEILRVSSDLNTSEFGQTQTADTDASITQASLIYTRIKISTSALNKLFLYLCNYRNIRMAMSYMSAWDIMRWNAQSITMIAVSICSGIFSTLSAILYFVDGVNIAGLALGLHAVLVILSFCGMRFVNLYQTNSGQYSHLYTYIWDALL